MVVSVWSHGSRHSPLFLQGRVAGRHPSPEPVVNQRELGGVPRPSFKLLNCCPLLEGNHPISKVSVEPSFARDEEVHLSQYPV